MIANDLPNISSWTLTRRPAPRWEYRPFDPTVAASIAIDCAVSPLVSRVFAARGITCKAQIDEFLEPSLATSTHDPFLCLGMEPAVDRILRAIKHEEPIWIYGDYDVDGITATAILKSTFDFLGVTVQTYIPHRLNEGYGLRIGAVQTLAAKGAKLIITVDNGTTALEEIALAKQCGIDVIVTDHHEPSDELPDAFALINPKQRGCEYPFKELCGAGVSFKLAHALLKRAAKDIVAAKAFLKSLLDFVAVGTVADIVPILGENRCFVSHGLKILRNGCRPGFKGLFEIIGMAAGDVDAGNLAYTVAPRLNAAGRTEHAGTALELLLATDATLARGLASVLNRLNDERRRIEIDITEEAMALIDEGIDSPIIVVEQEGWHLGVVGIVASRVLERYYRPVIVLGVDGEWAKGSARSIRGFDIHAALHACGEHLEQFGGHTMAAGLRLKSSGIDAFRVAIKAHARLVLKEEDVVPRIMIDARAAAEDLTLQNVEALEAMGPFGSGNPKPMIAVENVSLTEEPRVLKEKHLKLHCSGRNGQTFQAIGFSLGHRAPHLRMGMQNLALAGTPCINRWNGQRRVELEIKDFRAEK